MPGTFTGRTQAEADQDSKNLEVLRKNAETAAKSKKGGKRSTRSKAKAKGGRGGKKRGTRTRRR
jgi:hypothetical protein